MYYYILIKQVRVHVTRKLLQCVFILDSESVLKIPCSLLSRL